MENIALPEKIKFNKGKSDNEAQIVIEPCFPGYGVTLGNSVRRVLLSSLPGAAPCWYCYRWCWTRIYDITTLKRGYFRIYFKC